MLSEQSGTPGATLAALFTFQKPTEETIPKFLAIREKALEFARVVDANCPPCADRTTAIRCIREAVMNANASIALNGASYR